MFNSNGELCPGKLGRKFISNIVGFVKLNDHNMRSYYELAISFSQDQWNIAFLHSKKIGSLRNSLGGFR